VYSTGFAAAIATAVEPVETRPRLYEVGELTVAGAQRWSDVGRNDSESAIDEAAPEDLLYIGYTSGTTGQPKGAMIDHRTCRVALPTAALAYGLPLHGHLVMSASLSYVAAVIVHFWTHLFTGASISLLGPYDLQRQLELIERRRGTFTYFPTPVIREASAALAGAPRATESLRVVNIGASPIPEDAIRDLTAVIGGRAVATYGLTEGLGTPVCAARLDDWTRGPAGFRGAGRSVPPAVLALVDPSTGEPVAHDGEAVGELAARTPVRMTGYWNAPELSKTVLRGDWLFTGDLASIDPNGYVAIRGRAKEMIISGGINVYPAEVESVLELSGLVREVAIVGAPHEKWGETVVAFVVPRISPPPTGFEQQVIDYCRAQMAHYKCPTRVIAVDTLPRNANGKVLKRELVALTGAEEATKQ
jgi:acyl-CoA synthetase (AMP-forming)/AMP-acid ligase II